MNFPWNPKLFRWMSLRCKKIPDMYENNNLNHHPGFHMFYINLMFPSIVFHVFFFHIFSPLPSPGLVFQFGLDLRCRSKCLEAKLYHRLRLSNSQQRQEMLENLSQVGGWENLTRKNDGTWWKSRFMKFGTPYFHPKNRGIQMFNQQLKLGMQDPRSCSCDLFAELFHLILRWMPVAWY